MLNTKVSFLYVFEVLQEIPKDSMARGFNLDLLTIPLPPVFLISHPPCFAGNCALKK